MANGTLLPMNSPWFVHGLNKNLDAPLRLFCFPYAGGTGFEFRDWGARLPNVEVLGVFYPGRASRYNVPLIDNLDEMVTAIANEMADYEDKPFAFFGHSLGGLIAFELTRRFRQAGRPLPNQLIISACDAPQFLPKPPIIHHLPDDEFIKAIGDFGGTPDAILEHQEILAMLTPMLKADVKIFETYHHEPEAPLEIPLHAVGGSHDKVVEKENLLAWQEHTSGAWTAEFFEGAHFYYREEESGRFFSHLNEIIHENM